MNRTNALGKSNNIAKAVGRQDQWWNSIPLFRTIGGVVDGISKQESFEDIMKVAGANGIRDIGDVGGLAANILLPGSGRVTGGITHGLNQLANDIEFA